MDFPDRRTLSVFMTAIAFAAALAVIYLARSIIIIFVLSILFAYLVHPVVRFLQLHALFFKNLRGPHIVEAYVLFLAAVFLVVRVVFPGIQSGLGHLVSAVSAVAEKVSSGELAATWAQNLGWNDSASVRAGELLRAHSADVGNLLREAALLTSTSIGAILVVPILAMFFLNDGERMVDYFIRIFSRSENVPSARALAEEVNVALQRYIRAKVTLALLSFAFCSLAMLVLRIPHALALGIVAGILEFIPVAGWMIAAAIIVSFVVIVHSHWIWMLTALCLWRILMDYWIAPRVMGHELEIHPLLAIFLMMVGGAVGGIVGIYLSVPLAAVGRVFANHLLARKAQRAQLTEA